MSADRPGAGSSVLGWLAQRLTARDRWLLRMLHEHTVLTTTHLHRLGWGTGLRQVQARVRALRGFEVIDGFQPWRGYGHGSHPVHVILGPVGAQVLAAETGLAVADLDYRGRTRALTIAHRLTLRHDVAVTDLVCDLATTPGIEVVRWWSARRCGRYFGHHTRPDAYLTLTTHPDPHPDPRPDTRAARALAPVSGVGAGWWEMFLEYDTGTENLTQLAAKVAGYHSLAEHTGVVTPVGVWFTRPGREPSARRALTDALQALPLPDRVPILTGAPHPDPAPDDAVRHAAVRHAAADVGGRRGAVGVGVPPGWAALASGAGTGAGRRVWLPLRPGRVERVALTTLATPHPRARPDTGARPDPGPGGGFGSGADPAGPLPDPTPTPPARPASPRSTSGRPAGARRGRPPEARFPGTTSPGDSGRGSAS